MKTRKINFKLALSLTKMNEAIISGQGEVVKKIFIKLDLKSLPNEVRTQYAEIAIRVALPNIALKILNPLTKIKSQLHMLPEEVRMTYGASLIQVGVFKLGLRILESINNQKNPKALLFRSIAYLNEWNSNLAIPLLVEFIQSDLTTNYEKMIGNINLAAACVSDGQLERAEGVLSELISVARNENRTLILGNCLELYGQVFLLTGKIAKAEDFFSQAVEVLKSANTLPVLWAKKWLAIGSILRGVGSIEALNPIRKEAIQRQDFETLRDCDLFQAKFEGNVLLAHRVYFGTSYAGYKKRMARILGDDLFGQISGSFNFVLEQNPNVPPTVLDLFKGEFSPHNVSLDFDSLSHRLTLSLASDLYKPIKIGNLFMALFPDEIFDPYSSPARIHMAMTRFRNWTRERNLHIEIKENHGLFYLDGQNLSIFYSKPIVRDEDTDLKLNNLKMEFEDQEFKVKDISKLLKISERSAQRMLAKYMEKEELSSYGAGKNLKYFFKKSG